MESLQKLAACIGLSGNFSIVGGFFGYASPPPWNQAPSQANLPQSLSLLTQMKRLKQKHFHLDLVRVGTDSNGLLPPADEQNLDCAVQLAREIYGAIGIGIGRVNRSWVIPLSDHTGFDVIDDDSEAVDLVDEFDAPGGGIDVFVVQSWVGSTPGTIRFGLAPPEGDGVAVLSREHDFLDTARTLSHELGHYLGLGHENDKPNNLMCQSGKTDLPFSDSTHLNSDQVSDIKDSDDMHAAC